MAQIEIKDLSFKYKMTDDYSLKNVSLKIEKGDFVAVCGKTGCGKTTLIKSLKPDIMPAGEKKGQVIFQDKEIEQWDNATVSKKIGYVMQNPEHQIVTDKVWHELAFGLENFGEKSNAIRSKVAEIAEYFDITSWYNQDTEKLSGGQKQLLNLAAVMVMDPEVLLLDEPTSQLDPIAAERFLDTLKKINSDFGITVIISEHRLNYLLSMADKMLVMNDGRIIENDNTEKAVEKVLNTDIKSLMPIPSIVFAKNNGKGQVPISINQGRKWLENQNIKNTEKISESQNIKSVKKEHEAQNIKNIEKMFEKQDIKKQKIDNRLKVSLQCKNLWFRYEKNQEDVIKGLDFKAYQGEIMAVLGGNGTGKTTTIKVLAGLLKAYRGKVKLNGKIGLLPQNAQMLFRYESVQEELEDVDDLLIKEMGLEEFARMHPYYLSGGQQQKVALAKVLSLNPDILLLDEPTKGIDNMYKEQLGTMLCKLKQKNKTIVMVSHDLDFCGQYADRCGLFANGTLISIDDADKFFNSNRFYTTTVAKMCRGLVDGAYRVEDVIC